MKTKFSIIAVIAVLFFSSCEKSGTEPIVEQTPIGFVNPRVVGGTKALEATSTFATGDKIGVYANISSDATRTYAFMKENTMVNYNGSAWEYEPASYWPVDPLLTLDFFAYYPYSAVTAPLEAPGTSVVNNKLTGFAITHWVSPTPTAQTDLLWDWVIGATKAKPSGDDTNDPDPSTKLVLKHALSKIKFQAMLTGGTALALGTQIFITDITVQALNKGVFTTIPTNTLTTDDVAGAETTVPKWSDQAGQSSFKVLENALKTCEVTITKTTLSTGDDTADKYELLMIPQVTKGEQEVVQIILKYNVVTTVNAKETVVGGVETFKTFANDWEQGKQYTYTFNLGLDAITFSAKIDPWGTDTEEQL